VIACEFISDRLSIGLHTQRKADGPSNVEIRQLVLLLLEWRVQ